MAEKLRIGLLGAGRIGKLHAANVQNAIAEALPLRRRLSWRQTRL